MASFSNDVITSRQNPLITRMAKLSDKKYRDAEGLFRIDGVKLYSEAVKSGISVKYTFIAESAKGKLVCELANELETASGTVVTVSDEVFSKLTDESAPQGIVAVAEKFPLMPAEVPSGDFTSVYLSQLRDPGNLGTVIRTAYAFGVDRVYISSDCADIYSPKVIRAAMGTVFRQEVSSVKDEAEFATMMKAEKCPIYAAALRRDALKLGSFDVPNRVCFAIGNEGHGLSDSFINACDGTVFIPMAEGCESLNAASAATTLIWEMQRNILCKGEK